MLTENHNYLIIVGANKAGTTSLFQYLAEHPEVNPAVIKQTFFFLDREWQTELGLNSLYDYGEGLSSFDKFFAAEQGGKVRLEASPEYLFAPDVPGRLRDFLNRRSGRLIILLRDPVSRLRSLFLYGKQQGKIQKSVDFDEFLNRNVDSESLAYPSYMGRATGFYSKYLSRYMDQFSDNELEIVLFEELRDNPGRIVRNVVESMGLDGSYYDAFDFNIENRTNGVKSATAAKAYNSARELAIKRLYSSSGGRYVGGLIKSVVSPLYKRINKAPTDSLKFSIPSDLEDQLRTEYSADVLEVEKMIGRKTGWLKC